MNYLDTTSLSAEDINAIELRARSLRSQALADILRAGMQGLAQVVRKLATLFQGPRHA